MASKIKDKFKEADKPEKPLTGGVIAAPDESRVKLKGKRFLFTAAQNNTDVHPGFLKALESMAADIGAQIVVSPFTYNKNGFQNQSKDQDELFYDPKVSKYMLNKSAQVAEGLIFCGELDILPTAVDPLSGLENYCRGDSGIVPHAKVALKSLPGMPSDGARFLYTTGAVTQRNYIQRKAGQKAEFHHVFGALLVEIDNDGQWHARQIIADKSGSFYDLTTLYKNTGRILRNQRVEAINWGDIHVEKPDHTVSEVSFFAKDSILNQLKPKFQFIHDLSDFSTRNHHNIKDPHFLAKELRDGNTVEAGLRLAADFLVATHRPTTVTVVVESNHDLAYRRWLKEGDPKLDPINARFFHESNARVYKAIEEKDNKFHVFEWALRKLNPAVKAQFLTENDSFVICKTDGGIECGLHGHIGPNGSRGNPRNLRTIGRKANTGHTHSAGIVDGVYTSGVSANLDMGYNHGPSSWSHSHIVTHPNGKRQIITIKPNGKWRA